MTKKNSYFRNFIITQLHNSDEYTHDESDKKWLEPKSKRPDCIHKFKLADDDGNVYCYGYSNNDSSFSPLDDFGMPNWGCTTIFYRNPETGKYEQL